MHAIWGYGIVWRPDPGQLDLTSLILLSGERGVLKLRGQASHDPTLGLSVYPACPALPAASSLPVMPAALRALTQPDGAVSRLPGAAYCDPASRGLASTAGR